MADTQKFLKFKMGEHSRLDGVEKSAGTIYITTDEREMYVDTSDNSRIRIQGTVLYFENLTEFTNKVAPPYSTDLIYFIAEQNALVRWNGKEWVQLNTTLNASQEIANAVNTHTEEISNLSESIIENTRNIATNTENIATNTGNIAKNTEDIDLLKNIIGEGTDVGSGLIDRISTLESDLQEAQEDIKDISETIITFPDNYVSKTVHEQDITNINNIIGDDNTNGTIKYRVKQLEDRASNVEGRVTTLEESNEIIIGDIDDIKAQLVVIPETYTLNSVYEQGIGSINQNIEAINDKIGTNFIEGTTLSSRITDLESNDEEIEKYIDQFDEDIKNNSSAIKANVDAISSLGSRVTNAENTINNHIQDIAQIRADISQHDGTIQAHTTSIQSLDDRLKTAQDDIDDVSKTILTLASKEEVGQIEEDLQKNINEHIKAANAMTYKGGVDGVVNVLPTSGVKIGDTYVVTEPFNGWLPGDLLIAKGAETGDGEDAVITSNLSWDRVITGYDAYLNPSLSANTNSVVLNDYAGNQISAVQFKPDDANSITITTDTTNNSINLSIEWGSF